MCNFSLMNNWLKGYVVVFVILGLTLIAGFSYRGLDWLNQLFIVFSFYNLFIMWVGIAGRKKCLMKNDCYRPLVSLLIPARNEEYVIENTIRSIEKLNYRKKGRSNFEIVVVDDCSTDNTWAILKKLRREYSNLKVVRRTPENAGKGKSAALNEGLGHCKGEVIGVFDADTRVAPDFLKNSIPYLYDPDVAGVQGKVRIYNARTNALAAIQEDEFSVLAHCLQISRDAIGGMTTLGGNGQLTKREALIAVDGWNEYSPTEDLDLTLQLLSKNMQVRYCPDAELWQEGVETMESLLRQRSRWAEGFVKCLFDYFVSLLFSPIGLVKKFDGFITLTRVLMPFFIWIAYIFTVVALYQGVSLTCAPVIPPWLFVSATWIFFITLFAAFYRFNASSVANTAWRIARYWLYNFAVWTLAVPIGFYNGLKNLNTVAWDKTFHRGESVYAHPVGKAGYALSMEMVPEKTN